MKTEKNSKIRVFALFIAILIPILVGAFSAYLTGDDMKIYETMNRPALAPPGWVFPVVWTALYIMMGLASYLVYVSDADKEAKRKALVPYGVQLLMNFCWSALFFTYSRYLIALIWLLGMWLVILICTIRFYRIRRSAGMMMTVLFLWTTFAAYLNLACYILSITPMPLAA